MKILTGLMIVYLFTARLVCSEGLEEQMIPANSPVTWSHGILTLVYSSAPNVPIYSWDAGSVECPLTFTGDAIHLRNTGTENITVSCPVLRQNSGFYRTTTCPCTAVLVPGQTSTCTFNITFDPDADGVYHDTLRIQTNAWNGYGGFVRVPLTGTRITTPLSPQLVIQPQDSVILLAWSPVHESVQACPLTVRYNVYAASSFNSPDSFLTSTSDTSLIDSTAVSGPESVFYRVTAQEE